LLCGYFCKKWEAALVHLLQFFHTKLFLDQCASWGQGDKLIGHFHYVANQAAEVVLAVQRPRGLFDDGSLWQAAKHK
jgi:hypothetical protein